MKRFKPVWLLWIIVPNLDKIIKQIIRILRPTTAQILRNKSLPRLSRNLGRFLIIMRIVINNKNRKKYKAAIALTTTLQSLSNNSQYQEIPNNPNLCDPSNFSKTKTLTHNYPFPKSIRIIIINPKSKPP